MRRFIAALFAFALMASPAMATPPVFNGNVITQGRPTYDVFAYGAKGDGTTDDTSAFQNALNAAASSCGVVIAPSYVYNIASHLTIPTCVALRGVKPGPFYYNNQNPQTAPQGATLLASENAGNPSGTAFVTINTNGEFANFTVYYTNQPYTETTPVSYPWTIATPVAFTTGVHVDHDTFLNCYQCAYFHGGGNFLEHNYFGAISLGVQVDGSADTTSINDTHLGPIWNQAFNVQYPQNLDTWILANGIGYQFKRADGVFLYNSSDFNDNVAVDLTYSGTPGTLPNASYGQIVNCYFEEHNIGIRSDTTQSNGWQVTGTSFITTNTTEIQLNAPASGNLNPGVTVTGGLFLSNKAPQINAGYFDALNVYGYNAPPSPGVYVYTQPNTPTLQNGSIGVNGNVLANGYVVAGPGNGNCVAGYLCSGVTNGTGAVRLGGTSGCVQDFNITASSTMTVGCPMNVTGKSTYTTANTCSSTSNLPCFLSLTCTVSASTSCSTTAAVPTVAHCTVSYNPFTSSGITMTVLNAPNAGNNAGTLNVQLVSNTSQTGTIGAIATCV